MYEAICINRQDRQANGVDIGLLAECLVFYGKVHLISDEGAFRSLVRMCGPETLLELFGMGVLTIEFFENRAVILTKPHASGGQRHQVANMDTPSDGYERAAHQLFTEITAPSGKGFSKLMRRFAKYVRPAKFPYGSAYSLPELADKHYTSSAAASVLCRLAPEYTAPNPLIFETSIDADRWIDVRTNVDLDAANNSYAKHVPAGYPPLSIADVLSELVGVSLDIDIASRYSADMLLGPLRSVLAACKVANIVTKADTNLRALDIFREVVIPDSRSIWEAVNSGERNFADVLRLVERSTRFKEWLKGQSDSAELRDEYCRAVSRIDWADRLAPKAVRWLLIWLAGLAVDAIAASHVGVAGSVGLSAADALFFDKLIKGWRPNQFIDGPLKDFLKLQ